MRKSKMATRRLVASSFAIAAFALVISISVAEGLHHLDAVYIDGKFPFREIL